jgi:ligand-binding sensor domain-containing protein
MTTYGGGIWKYDGKTLTNQEVKKGAENVLLVSVYQDNKGTIWLGTDNDGVYKQNGDKFEKFELEK